MIAQLDSLELGIQSHVSRCIGEAREMKDELETKERQLITAEKDADERLKVLPCVLFYFIFFSSVVRSLIAGFRQISEQGLRDALRETDEETQMCARKLLQLINFILDYKEFVEVSTAGMKKDL